MTARRRPARPGPARRTGLLAPVGVVVAALVLAGCAEPPVLTTPVQATAATAVPAVERGQSEQVRGEVAARLLAARVAGDPALVEAAASGPAAALEQLRVRVDGPQPDAVALAPAPATVLVAPQVDGWPRWFATVTDPAVAAASGSTAVPDAADAPATGEPTAEPTVVPDDAAGVTTDPAAEPSAADGEPSLPADAEGTGAPVAAEPPVLEVYDAVDVRSPYRLWARLTLLPGAALPVFADPAVGAEPLAAGTGPGGPADGSADPSGGPSADPSGDTADSDPEPTDPAAAERAELLAVLDDLAVRYAAVMTDGDASEFAAEFQPDAFVEAVRARAAAEREAVADVAGTEVVHAPFGDGEVLYAARAADGDVLAVTAVQTTTTMTARPGVGVLQPGAEVRAAAGIEETDGTLTTRSVAALAFVVPAEQGAIRLVAVGEGLVGAEAP